MEICAMRSGTHSPASSALSWGSGSFTYDGEEFVEVTLDLHGNDMVTLRSVEPTAQLGSIIHHDTASFSATPCSSRSSSVRHSSSNRFLQLSQELKAEAVARARQFSHEIKAEFKRLSNSRSKGSGRTTPTSCNGDACSAIESALAARAARRQRAMLDRTRSGAQRAIRGLRFISNSKANAWSEVENTFHALARDGYLCRSDFPECIGMTESGEFALELFDTLSRRRSRQRVEKICKEELHEIWAQITDESFDSRLQIFFDMVDKNADGRIGEEEVKEVVVTFKSNLGDQ